MSRAGSSEKTLMLGKIEGKRGRGRQRMRWLDGITDSMDVSLSWKGRSVSFAFENSIWNAWETDHRSEVSPTNFFSSEYHALFNLIARLPDAKN